MLPENSIHKITDYYFEHPEFRPEIERSFLEFFGVPSVERLQEVGVNGDALPLLNEWFVYDFQFKNGKSTLADYLERHPESIIRGKAAVKTDTNESKNTNAQ